MSERRNVVEIGKDLARQLLEGRDSATLSARELELFASLATMAGYEQCAREVQALLTQARAAGQA